MAMAMARFDLLEKQFDMDTCTGISSLLFLKSSSKQFVNLLFSSNQSIFSLQIPRNQLKDKTANKEKTKTLSLDSIQTLYSLRTAAERVDGECQEGVENLVCLDDNGQALELETIEQMIMFKDHLVIAAGSILYSSRLPLGTVNGEFFAGKGPHPIRMSILEDYQDEEINDVCSDNKDKIMVSLDSGSVLWLEVSVTGKEAGIRITRKVLSKDQHAVMANTVALRPTLPWHALSGGFDCKLMHWDSSKGICKYSHDFAVMNETGFCNPPYVHSLDVSPSGNRIASGLANGKIVILSLSRTLKTAPSNAAKEIFLEGGHSWTVSQLLFLKEDWLLSASIDKTICVWKLYAAVGSCTIQATANLDFKINSVRLIDICDSGNGSSVMVAVAGAGKGALSIVNFFLQ